METPKYEVTGAENLQIPKSKGQTQAVCGRPPAKSPSCVPPPRSPHFQGPKYAGEYQRSPSLNRLQTRTAFKKLRHLETLIEPAFIKNQKETVATVLLEADGLGALALHRAVDCSKAMNQNNASHFESLMLKGHPMVSTRSTTPTMIPQLQRGSVRRCTDRLVPAYARQPPDC